MGSLRKVVWSCCQSTVPSLVGFPVPSRERFLSSQSPCTRPGIPAPRTRLSQFQPSLMLPVLRSCSQSAFPAHSFCSWSPRARFLTFQRLSRFPVLPCCSHRSHTVRTPLLTATVAPCLTGHRPYRTPLTAPVSRSTLLHRPVASRHSRRPTGDLDTSDCHRHVTTSNQRRTLVAVHSESLLLRSCPPHCICSRSSQRSHAATVTGHAVPPLRGAAARLHSPHRVVAATTASRQEAPLHPAVRRPYQDLLQICRMCRIPRRSNHRNLLLCHAHAPSPPSTRGVSAVRRTLHHRASRTRQSPSRLGEPAVPAVLAPPVA